MQSVVKAVREPVEEFHFTLPIETAALVNLRHGLRTWLASIGVTGSERDDVVLATHEAAADAIEHAKNSEAVWVDAFFLGGEITIEVHDTREWRDDGVSEDRGRGLSLAELLVSQVEVLKDARGTTIRMLCS